MANKSTAGNDRPSGPSNNSDNLSVASTADRVFPVAVAELGHSTNWYD